MGADDYISKPFRPRELVSRIGVVLRRSGKTSAVLESGGITIDTGKAVVKREGNEIFLSALEYRILLILFQFLAVLLYSLQVIPIYGLLIFPFFVRLYSFLQIYFKHH